MKSFQDTMLVGEELLPRLRGTFMIHTGNWKKKLQLKVSFNRVFIEYHINHLWEKLRELQNNGNWGLARRSLWFEGKTRDMKE